MLTVSENETDESREVSVRYDDGTRTYYCFYRRTDHLSADLTLSYDLNERKWLVETHEYKQCLERPLNKLFENHNLPFEDQVRRVIDYLDTHFGAFRKSRARHCARYCSASLFSSSARRTKDQDECSSRS